MSELQQLQCRITDFRCVWIGICRQDRCHLARLLFRHAAADFTEYGVDHQLACQLPAADLLARNCQPPIANRQAISSVRWVPFQAAPCSPHWTSEGATKEVGLTRIYRVVKSLDLTCGPVSPGDLKPFPTRAPRAAESRLHGSKEHRVKSAESIQPRSCLNFPSFPWVFLFFYFSFSHSRWQKKG